MKTSIVILTHNQLHITKLCLDSIRAFTGPSYEMIVVDNGSSDGTVDYLRSQSDVKAIFNSENKGFAKGCNQGWEASSGDCVLYLNNDTIVTPGWLEAMLEVLDGSARVGMVGPVTNYASGQQMIPVGYTDLKDLNAFARAHAESKRGQSFEVRRLVGFCLLVKRHVMEEVGGFDERFGLGNFEDDDLCLRVRNRGYQLRVVEDCYIHHFGHMTMSILQGTNLMELLGLNRIKAQEKWGEDIIGLIYREPATISLVAMVRNGAPVSRGTLEAMKPIVDEIAVWLEADTEEARHAVGDYADRIADTFEHAMALATRDFVLVIDADEEWDEDALRLLSGLKVAVGSGTEAVELLVARPAGESGDLAAGVRRCRLVRRSAGLSWNGITGEFIVRNRTAIETSGITIRSTRLP